MRLGIWQCRISQNHTWMPPDSWKLDLLSNDIVESFWGALWPGIQALLCFSMETRRIVHGCPQIHGNSICYRTMLSRASGMPCGSVFGRFCVLVLNLVELHADAPKFVGIQFATE